MQNARKRFWWSWALLAVVMVAKSSTFVNIDWSTLSRDSLLPRVAETVNLGAGWQDCRYRVHIDYPEYEPFTKTETDILKKLNITPTDTLSYSWSIGVSRKEGIGQLSIIPVVKKGGRWLKLVSYKLRLETSAPSLRQVKKQKVDQDRYAAHSVLREGRWVKIRVSEEGIYQLTPSLLSRMGFGDIDKVKVYGYGGRVQNAVIKYTGTDADTDDLEEVPLYRRSDALLFYANGTLRWSPWTWLSAAGRYVSERSINPYSKYSCYFVTEGDAPLRIAAEDTTKWTPQGQTVTTYPEHLLLETDNYSWYTSGRHLYDSYNFATGSSKSYTLATPDLDTSTKSWLRVVMGAYAQEETRAEVTLNGKSEGIIVMGKAGQYDYAIQGSLAKSTEDVVTGENTLNISSTASHDARLDYISLNYDRQLRLVGTFLPFSHYLTGTRRFQLQGADASTQIWRIGQAGEVMQSIPGNLSGGVLSFNVKDATRRYVAVNTAAQFPEPEVVGQIANQDLHADSVADMVIIIPASGKLLSQAERLADFHRTNDSLRVRVIRADQIYNEFSSGTPDAGAYRRYMKMLYDRAEVDADCPRYLLLFGGCLWDNRMLTTQTRGLDPDDYLLCYESENSVSEVSSYVTDDFFGLLDDGEGGELTTEKIDVGIGRFPVTTAADAQTLVDKTISYVNNANVGAWKNAIYMMADDGDNNGHMKDAEAVAGIVESNYSPMMVKRIYWDAYPRVVTATGNTYPEVTSAIKNAMKKGALIMNYSGHGAPYQISHEQVLKLADFKEFSSSNVPMWVIASCILTPYDMPTENIGEVSMLNKNGAAVAFFSASRAVYSDLNRYLNKNYMNYVLGSDAEGRRYTIGDAARLTKVNLVNSRLDGELDYTINKLKYALMGDPALTLSMPTAQVVLDEINGKKIESDRLPQLKAGSVVTIKGHVEANGVLLPDFTGSVSLLLQDSQDTIVCKNNVGADVSPYIYKERTKTLYEGSDSVKNGVFQTRFPVPLDIHYTNGSGRLNFYAVNMAHTIEANGYSESFTVGGSEDVATGDSLGPKMFVYLNTPEFKDGGTVNETPYFYAVLSDSDGINTTGNGVGHDLQLTIDGEEEMTYILNDYYENDFGSFTSGSVAFHLPALEAGKHRLFFRAWDLKNHSSSTVLNFNVQEGLQPSILDVNVSRSPATTSTNFIISYDRPDEDTQFVVEVYDCFGRLWWKHQETGSSNNGYYLIPWNLTGTGGIALPSGLYLYKVAISCNGSKQSTKSKKIIIHRQ